MLGIGTMKKSWNLARGFCLREIIVFYPLGRDDSHCILFFAISFVLSCYKACDFVAFGELEENMYLWDACAKRNSVLPLFYMYILCFFFLL